MISDEKRREVVRELRGLDVFTDPIDGAELYDSGEVENALGFEYEDYGWYYASGVDALADLIDLPTCQMKSVQTSSYRVCSRCGAFIRNDAVTNCTEVIPVRFCPNCDAMVVEKEEDDG